MKAVVATIMPRRYLTALRICALLAGGVLAACGRQQPPAAPPSVRSGVLMFLTGGGFYKIAPPLTIDREAL